MRFNRLVLWTLLGVTVYCLAHWLWYLGTPLGLSPSLDGRENLLLAQDIARGELAKEPFYRAMLYPALLALLSKAFPASLVFAASLLGLLCHLANALLAMRIAQRIWEDRIAVLISGALVGLNPVLIHFATDPLDITIATTFGLLSLFFWLRGAQSNGGLASFAASGSFLALACATRPHFFAVAIVAVFALALFGILRKHRLPHTGAFIGGLASGIALYSGINFAWSGSPSPLPWQGAYNLWVSNKPGASGLYFTQSLDFHYVGEHRNPNRLESEELYRQETGERGTISERSAYWRNKTIRSILHSPGDWMKLMAWKGYALVNTWEQYNNKTYAFHKERAPWLRYNPIGWGILFTIGLCGLVHLWRVDRPAALPITLFLCAFAAGIVLYMASGRFRVPLVPVFAILGGGLPVLLRSWPSLPAQRRIRLCALALIAGLLTFSSIGPIRSRATYVQDCLLLADASAQLGQDATAYHWASEALKRDPSRSAARRLQLISFYNLATLDQEQSVDANWSDFEAFVLSANFDDPVYQLVKGVTLWKTGHRDQALEVWERGYERFGMSASACMAMRLILDPEADPPRLNSQQAEQLRRGDHGLLAFALIERGLGERINLEMTTERRRILRSNIDALFAK